MVTRPFAAYEQDLRGTNRELGTLRSNLTGTILPALALGSAFAVVGGGLGGLTSGGHAASSAMFGLQASLFGLSDALTRAIVPAIEFVTPLLSGAVDRILELNNATGGVLVPTLLGAGAAFAARRPIASAATGAARVAAGAATGRAAGASGALGNLINFGAGAAAGGTIRGIGLLARVLGLGAASTAPGIGGLLGRIPLLGAAGLVGLGAYQLATGDERPLREGQSGFFNTLLGDRYGPPVNRAFEGAETGFNRYVRQPLIYDSPGQDFYEQNIRRPIVDLALNPPGQDYYEQNIRRPVVDFILDFPQRSGLLGYYGELGRGIRGQSGLAGQADDFLRQNVAQPVTNYITNQFDIVANDAEEALRQVRGILESGALGNFFGFGDNRE